MIRLFLFFIIVIITINCERKTPEFYTTNYGLKYKYHDISIEETSPKKGDYITVYMIWKTTYDSIFYDSKNNSPQGKDIIILGKPKHLGGIEEGFYKSQKGDSISFYIEPKRFYKDYLSTNKIPKFLEKQEEIIITIRVLNIENEKEYKKRVEYEKEIMELKELENINKTIKKWKVKYDTVLEIDGSYLVMFNNPKTEKIKYGSFVKIHYKASFINGKLIYSTYKNGKPDEFQIGKEGQMVEGLSNTIKNMHYNQKGKILVPSYKGFGSKGSLGNIIPPFTPVIYDIEILPL